MYPNRMSYENNFKQLWPKELEELVAEYGHRAGQQPPAGRDQAEGDDGAHRSSGGK